MGIRADAHMAARLVRAREEAGMTQADLGRAIKVTQQTVSRWEAATQSMLATQVRDVCQELGVSSDYLLFGVARHNECPPEGRPACSYIKVYRRSAQA